jgi:hypothetical protein
VANLVGAVNVNSATQWILKENIDREGFKYAACGTGPNNGCPLVIVLDDDNDLEALKNRPLGEIHPSILRVKSVLDRPDVWERSV